MEEEKSYWNGANKMTKSLLTHRSLNSQEKYGHGKAQMGLLAIKSITSQSVGDTETPLEIFTHIQKQTVRVTTTCLLET